MGIRDFPFGKGHEFANGVFFFVLLFILGGELGYQFARIICTACGGH